MPSPTEITVAQLSRLVGLPNAPTLVDVRSDKEFQTDPRLVPTSRRHDSSDPAVWWKRYAGQSKADTTLSALIGIVCCERSDFHGSTAKAEPFG